MSVRRDPSRPPIALGLGCDRGTPAATIARAIDEALARAGAGLADVRAIASIDLKADEAGLLELATQQGWTIVFHRAAALAAVEVPNPSETVRRHTGTPSVSEAAALLAAGTDLTQLLVEKHKLRGPDGRNATVSVARMPTIDCAATAGPAEYCDATRDQTVEAPPMPFAKPRANACA